MICLTCLLIFLIDRKTSCGQMSNNKQLRYTGISDIMMAYIIMI